MLENTIFWIVKMKNLKHQSKTTFLNDHRLKLSIYGILIDNNVPFLRTCEQLLEL